MDPLSVGILGCGNVSDAYLSNHDRFDCYDIVACANRTPGPAQQKAQEYGLTARDIDGLLADPAIDIVVNLTPPSAHATTTKRALAAGKHVYSEKPLATDTEEAMEILETAAEHDRLIGCAPDTILGAGLQTCRSLIDSGEIGDPVGASAIWTSSGHETWHPNPDLFYDKGGGPLYDVGPYYVTALVALLGPAQRVSGAMSQFSSERTVQSGPRTGETIAVNVPTHESGTIEFENGTIADITCSFETPGESAFPAPAFEIYGTDGTLQLPDPNYFEGPVHIRTDDTDGFEEISLTHEYDGGRGIGVADLVHTITSDWCHRTTGELAAHVLEIMDGIRTAADCNEYQTVDSAISRPAPVPAAFPDELVER